jgi:hypothetical protein
MLKRMIFLVAVLALAPANRMTIADEKLKAASVQVVALDDTATAFTAADLKKLPRTTVEVADRSGKKVKYSGVAVHQLLSQANAPLGEELRGEALRCYVSVKARDEYRVIFALCEFDPVFTDRIILLADEQDGKPLDEESGPFQIIVPGEKRRARWVRRVDRIRVMESRVVDEDMPVTPP